MGYIKVLKGKNLQNHSYKSDDELYPITISDAVFDNNGKSLTTYLNETNNKLTELENSLNNSVNQFNTTNNDLKKSILNVNSNLQACVDKSDYAISLAASKTSKQTIIKTNLSEFFSTITKKNNYYQLSGDSMLYLTIIWNNNKAALQNNLNDIILYIFDSMYKSLVVLLLPERDTVLNDRTFTTISNWYILSYNHSYIA